MSQNQKKIFTLMELLIVIAVIVMLIAILLPALNSARKKAQEAVCTANLKQIGIYLQSYTNDNDDNIMPVIQDSATASGYNWGSWFWKSMPYVSFSVPPKSSWGSEFVCNAAQKASVKNSMMCPASQFTDAANYGWFQPRKEMTYALNKWNGTPLGRISFFWSIIPDYFGKIGKLRSPSSKGQMFELCQKTGISGDALFTPGGDAVNVCYRHHGGDCRTTAAAAEHQRPGSMMSVGYADGHVGRIVYMRYNSPYFVKLFQLNQ